MARFTQYHYKVVAQVLSDHSADEEIIRSFMDVFEADNPRFKSKLFFDAAMEIPEYTDPLPEDIVDELIDPWGNCYYCGKDCEPDCPRLAYMATLI